MGIACTTEEFIEKAIQIHNNKYDYSLVLYKNIFTPIKIICPIHGMFVQKPIYHLYEVVFEGRIGNYSWVPFLIEDF